MARTPTKDVAWWQEQTFGDWCLEKGEKMFFGAFDGR
jgi:hypothetical protein